MVYTICAVSIAIVVIRRKTVIGDLAYTVDEGLMPLKTAIAVLANFVTRRFMPLKTVIRGLAYTVLMAIVLKTVMVYGLRKDTRYCSNRNRNRNCSCYEEGSR